MYTASKVVYHVRRDERVIDTLAGLSEAEEAARMLKRDNRGGRRPGLVNILVEFDNAQEKKEETSS